MRKTASLSDQIRRAIDASGKSRYQIAKELGVSQAMLSLFMSRRRGLSLDMAQRLCAHLGLNLTAQRQRTE